jgi:hypothetical protein
MSDFFISNDFHPFGWKKNVTGKKKNGATQIFFKTCHRKQTIPEARMRKMTSCSSALNPRICIADSRVLKS